MKKYISNFTKININNIMNSKQTSTQTQTITQFEKRLIEKGKKVIYLVLKPKTFGNEIIDSLHAELEKRFGNFVKQISPQLNNIKFEDEENSVKYIMLRAISEILTKMMNERMINLSSKDKKIIDDIFTDERKNIDKKEKNKPDIVNRRKSPTTYGYPYNNDDRYREGNYRKSPKNNGYSNKNKIY